MIADGATQFTELGPGSVLQGLIKKVGPRRRLRIEANIVMSTEKNG